MTPPFFISISTKDRYLPDQTQGERLKVFSLFLKSGTREIVREKA
jgi:hypothetical protein